MTENNRPSLKQIAVNYGVITALMVIIYSLILHLAGLYANKALGYIGYIILIIGITFAHSAFKKANNGYMSYREGLGLGVLISLFSGFLFSVFTYIYIKFIDHTVIPKSLEEALLKLEEQGLGEQEIEKGMEMMEKFTTPGFISLSLFFFFALFGLLFSLILSAITKRDNLKLQTLDEQS